MIKYGWVCPLCGKVSAPFMVSCDCINEQCETEEVEDESTN